MSSDLAKPAPPEGGSALRLFNFERRWLLAVIETVIPSGADPRIPLGAADVPMGRFVDDLLDSAPLQFVMGIRACIWVVMLAPLFVLKRAKSFLGLDAEERMSVLERLRQSDVYLLREMPLLFKTVGCLGFCGLPAVHHELGIAPTDSTPPEWARRKR